jgi:serine/threonine protein kinase
MGEVYRARDTRLDRTVAIKILPDTLADDPHFRERFDREARTISQLDDPHICALYDVGRENGTSYLVMQYLEGETLAARLLKGPLAISEALKIGIEIAKALERAHRAGVIHRDLKPGNVMLTRSGAKLLDFGLAKANPVSTGGASVLPTTPVSITAQGTILGTFQYMAPEQIEGQEADARTDLFRVGCGALRDGHRPAGLSGQDTSESDRLDSPRRSVDGRGRRGLSAAAIEPRHPDLPVEVRAGEQFDMSVPRSLFLARLSVSSIARNRCVVTPDAQRFLLVAPPGQEAQIPTTVVLNWVEQLKSK